LAAFTERTDGIYGGVGMLVSLDSSHPYVNIVTVFKGSPAEGAGLLPGDLITEVNGDSVVGKRLEEVTSVTKGLQGTPVTLTILRPGEGDAFRVDIIRQVINVPTVHHHIMDDDVGYIRIDTFDRVTTNQFIEAYIDLMDNHDMKGLILDLRNNPGGLLDVVADIGRILLPAGIITYTEDKHGNRNEYISEGRFYRGLPLVVLVNEGSASASEVLTGAVKDFGVGTIVGQRTFGKGIVQSLFDLVDGSAIKLTISKYYTPNGISIHGEGIMPDIVVEVDRETAMRAARLTFEEDIQLQKAFDVMLEKLQ
jgi:carboxyl-terminal processing protease